MGSKTFLTSYEQGVFKHDQNKRNGKIPCVEMRYLSMGMSNSYKIAIEEGANIVRIGTILFGNRIS
ncbi:MAG TPA: hypothetical protein VMV77_00345 [Bacteroidales bacterium]|nr:hypothetical protein [Bacteroidales bacterium]